MFTSLKHIDDEWRSHHRRYIDHPSLLRDIVLTVSMLCGLIILLMIMPW